MKEIDPKEVAEEMSKIKYDELDMKLFQLMGKWGMKKEKIGIIEMTIGMLRESYEMSKEDMKKKLAEKLDND